MEEALEGLMNSTHGKGRCAQHQWHPPTTSNWTPRAVRITWQRKGAILLFSISAILVVSSIHADWSLFRDVTRGLRASSDTTKTGPKMSVDSWRKSGIRNTDIPRWNYALLRCQIFLVYFIAGLKKTDRDWIGGYSMEGLGQHWVFDLFKLVITEEQVDAYVVHWGGFLLDLTVGFFMVASAVRPFGVLFCVLFNAMNSRMFAIGMFPYVMIVLTTIFFGYSWPKKLAAILPQYMRNMVPDLSPSRPDFLNCWYPGRRKVSIHSTGSRKVELRLRRWKMTAFLVCLHVLLQLFLPYSHGITKGYNTWTQGSYGYSWDMMVHNWRPVHVKLVLYDNATHRAHFVDPEKFTTSRRWYHQADMVVQFAHCIRDRVQQDYGMKDIEIYVDDVRPNGEYPGAALVAVRRSAMGATRAQKLQ
ncbi:hypothetical protein MRX96_036095 [Rhipicephalus microplus]